MKKEKSCGVMIFKDNTVLLVHQNEGHWSLPKGHVEPNETEEETAIREAKEETNIDVKILGDFRKVVTYSPRPNVLKDVVFFLGEATNDELKPQLEEASEVRYIDIDESIELLNRDMKKIIISGYDTYKQLKKAK